MSLSLTTVVSGFTYTPSSGIYTNITSVEFTVTFSEELLDFNAIWLFGDGTYSAGTETTVEHTYSKPGTYLVSLIAFNTIEEFRNYLVTNGQSLSALPTSQEYLTYTQSVSVVNFVTDSISYVNAPDGVLQSRVQTTPFRIEFQSSRNAIPSIQLFSENSISQPWQTVDPKWSHLKPQWRFLDSEGERVDSIQPKQADVVTLIKNGTAALSATPFDPNISSTLNVGVSGFVDFYYVDDMPGEVILHATLDTAQYNNPYDKEYVNTVPSYANSTLTLTTNYTVSGSQPYQLRIDSNGIPTFTLEGTKWQFMLMPYVITIVDSEGYALRNYPLTNAHGDAYPINRSLVSINSAGVIFEIPIANFQRYDENGFDVGGHYEGFLQPLSSIGFTQLYATVTMATSAGLISLTGASVPFDIVSYNDVYDIRKFNEDFDMAATIKSYALQETIARNTVLFDGFIGQIVGDADSPPEDIGKSTYEKISNYVDNHSDIDKCNIDKLYSICQELGIPIDNYNLDYPANLKRILNILSISYSRLKGSREKFSRDFIRTPTIDSATNLGSELTTNTYQITAGTDIVIHEKFTDAYELFLTVPLSGADIYPLWSLSAFNLKTPLDTYYDFFAYISGYTDTQVEGVINWGSSGTTLTEGVSSIDVWLGQSGSIDAILDYQLRRGLELINN